MLIKALGNSVNWEFYNYLQYLKTKQAIEESNTTLIPEEFSNRQVNRPTLYNRCLLGDGTTTIDLSTGIVGTLTLKGWTKEGGIWAYRDITTGLAGTILTLQSSVYYKSIDRLVNGVKRDTAVCEEGAGLILYTNIGDELPVTTANINLVRVTQDDAPLLPESGDYVGFKHSLYNFNADTSATGSSYIDTSDNLVLSGSGDFTISFIAKLDATYLSFSCFLDKGFADGIEIVVGAGLLRVWWQSTKVIDDVNLGITYTDYNRFTFRRNGNSFEVEVNGVLKTTGDCTGKSIGTANDWIIGSQLYPIEIYQFKGFMGDVRFYDSVISHSDIVNRTTTPTRDYQVYPNYWKDDISNSILEFGNNGNNGGVIIMPTSVSNSIQIQNTYTGRKDQPITVGGVAVNLDTTRNKEIQCSQSLTGVTVTAVYGEEATTGNQLTTSMIGVDTVNNKLYNNNSSGYDIKLARVDLSDGTQSVYLGGIDNNGNEIASDKLYDASQVDGVIGTIIYDTQDYHTSQKYYNHWVLYGASQNKISLSASNYNVADEVLFSTSTYFKRYNNGILRYPVSTDNTGTPIVSTALGETAGLKSDYILVIITPQNTSFESQRIDVLTTFINADYSITLESNSNCYIYVLDLTLINAIAAYVASKVDTYGDLRFLVAGNYTTVYLDSLKDWYDNNASYQAGLDAILSSYDAGLDYTTWYNYTSPFANMATAYVSNGFALYYEKVHNGALTTYTANSFVANAVPGGANASQWWINNSIPLTQVDVFRVYALNPASGQNWFKLHGDFIKDTNILAGLTDGSNTDSRFGETNEYPFGIHLNNTQKPYVQLPPFKTLEYAYQSNEEYWRDKLDTQGNAVLDRHLVPLSLEHSDKDFPAITLDFSAGDYIQGDIGEDWTSVTITGYKGDPTYSISDFTIDTINNRISAVSADAQFAQIELSNGNVYHRRDATNVMHNPNGTNGTSVVSSTVFSYTTQNYWKWQNDWGKTTTILKAERYTL